MTNRVENVAVQALCSQRKRIRGAGLLGRKRGIFVLVAAAIAKDNSFMKIRTAKKISP